MNLSPYIISLIRTWVPMAVGVALTWGIHILNDHFGFAFSVDSEQVATVVVTIVSGVYYGIVRWAEARWPKAGWFLGMPTPPSY